MVSFTKPSSALDDVGFRGVFDLVRCTVPRSHVVYPTTSNVNVFSFKVKAGHGRINGKQVLAAVLSTIAQRPYSAVLGPNKEVKGTLVQKRDGPDASGFQ